MSIKLKGSSDGSVSFDAPADTSPSGSDITLTLPTSAGSANQFLKNSGIAGELEYSSMVETSTGLGIGTTSPDSLLTLDASSNPTINIKTGGTKRASLIADTGNNYALLGSFDGYPLVFSASAGGGTAERARIDTSGRLLVGTSSSISAGSSAGAMLQVEHGSGSVTGAFYCTADTSQGGTLVLGHGRGSATGVLQSGDTLGDIRFAGADGTDLQTQGARITAAVDATPGSNDMPGRLSFLTCSDGASAPTERMRINRNGHFFLGQFATTTPGYGNTTTGISMLSDGRIFSSMGGTFSQFNRNSNGSVISFARSSTGVGQISVTTSSTSYGTSSDYRLKENVVALDGAIGRVKQLLPKRFNFIVDADTTVDGFLAHEAQTVVPEAVIGTHNEVDDDGNAVMQSIDQSKLVPLLTAALQEAIAKIETLETKVAALEAA